PGRASASRARRRAQGDEWRLREACAGESTQSSFFLTSLRCRDGDCCRFWRQRERALERPRVPGARVVVERLAERDPDGEDEHADQPPDDPPSRVALLP